MKKKLFSIIFLTVFLYSNAQLDKIIIDPGHGGKDYGCHGKIAHEKNINLDISLKLGELINKYLPKTTVVYTRKTDKTLDLCDRAVSANAISADLFISIHCNASINYLAKGTEVYIQNNNLSSEKLTMLKNKLSHSSEHEQIETFNCPKNNFNANKMLKAASIAIKIDRTFKNLGLESKGVKKANFMILRKTRMSSILVECGFLTNQDEEIFLNSKNGQLQIATAILKALIEYKK